jgi:HAD superfamily hydrolase (TIGR01484 family)
VSAVLPPPRLVATDLDGTLLRTDGTVSARTRGALAATERAGLAVIFVTARPPRWLDPLAGVVAAHGVAICANGAIVYDVARRRVLATSPLSADSVNAVAEALRTELPGTSFAGESAAGFVREPGFVDSHPLRSGAPEAGIEAMLDPLPGKLLARHDTLGPEEFVARASAIVGHLVEIHVSGATGLLEMSARGVTKAAALAEFCAGEGVDQRDVWAVGDMPNDLPMLAWAGTSFAVANAHREVLATAAYVCPANDDDGVAELLELALSPQPDVARSRVVTAS